MTVVVVIEPDAHRRSAILQLLANEDSSFQLEGVDYACLFEEAIAELSPDLVLLCVHSYEDVFELTHAAQRVYSPRHMLLISGTTSVPYSLPRLRPILAGYVHESAPTDLLMASIRLILAGGECFPLPAPRAGAAYPSSSESRRPVVSSEASGLPRAAPPTVQPVAVQLGRVTRNPPKVVGDGASLAITEAEMLRITPRQYEVLVLLARGYPIKTVSRHLNISVSTAKAHTETLYQRLDVNNRSEAVYAAFARGATLGWDQQDLVNGAPKPPSGVVA